MDIIISGYGRMGREIEKAASLQNHQIIARIDSADDWKKLTLAKNPKPVIIDFSQPYVVIENIRKAFALKIPIITGTTGWDTYRNVIKKECIESNNTLFFASNFSIGMNLFFLLNKTLAHLTKDHPEYILDIEETHHIHKLDKPSGTAITLAGQIKAITGKYSAWVSDKNEDGKISIHSFREGEVPGTHRIVYKGTADQIEIIHTAKNRSGFAAGAIQAANWVQDRKGYFEMDDMLKAEISNTISFF